ncbi:MULTISPECIES: nuclear transport factor 2 family protein [Pseudomonas syringae group genomosp. 2]|uniref:Ketosteroid isomerase n=2 Tax=Pseudomonas syringae group genomosp. 2 TaxID=251698 RepID=A0A3M6AKK6_PSESS|nr:MULTISPECIES: nuclear transport factor 2 family protein [Pseudomonas syringae group genomosp. 2]KPX10533.1 Ketosteroid isomerase-related protein [Pseudomonas syringae pv. cunninghamiae]KPX69155.1 Ketosteroid isomerase-related protein [Pseudomonas amygdali pv. photiniae]RMS55437.1 Ketosteroid isomerase-related protein [Pseudomonas amygdali pv. photiniae]RMV09533.1 Ketosteroid isomerase [Pseudomonas savastanoi]RMV17576.1 Ketosteroid isomerase-related protein [Pseudomonas savastanoi]
MNYEEQSQANSALITRFYEAFAQLDAEAMSACYTDDVLFSDPAFGELRGPQVGEMWRMLTSRAKNFSVVFDQVRADDRAGTAHWVATYLFSQTGRTVVNDIEARFVFRDGKICEHRDNFDMWRWSRQALGLKGLLLGWTPLVRNAVRAQALKGLKTFSENRRA